MKQENKDTTMNDIMPYLNHIPNLNDRYWVAAYLMHIKTDEHEVRGEHICDRPKSDKSS